MKHALFPVLALTVILLHGCGSGSGTANNQTNASTEQPPSAPPPAATTADNAPKAAPAYAAVDDQRLLKADSEPGQWMTHGGTYAEQRYSKLDQINTDTVKQLGLAWFADLNTNRGQESTPIEVDGTIYVTESWSKVSAYNAKTGERLWFYDPKVPGQHGGMGCCDVVNRGVAVYKGKVYVGTYDGRLVALDAATGKVVWSVATFDPTKYYSITGAPRVVKGKVIIGNAGAEYVTRGYVTAYDAETGKQAWRFYTVPGNPADGFENDAMAKAAKTWNGQWWKMGGGGSTWDGITYDPQTDLVYVGVGNGSPWNPKLRSPAGGSNLYTVSIIALNPDNGELVWHYQEIPQEQWDYDATAQITVANLKLNGVQRHVIMQATKGGYFYVIDAASGKLLAAKNFVDVNWTTGYDLETGLPNLNKKVMYTEQDHTVIIQPGVQGAHNWQPVSYSKQTGLVYIPAQDVSIQLTNAPDSQFGAFRLGVDWISNADAYNDPNNKVPRGMSAHLVAWDPVKMEKVWERKYPGRPAGVLTTAGGLLFQGDGGAKEFVAYRADNGERLWAAPIQTNVSAGPITYELDDEQYVAQVVGGTSFGGGYYAPTYARLLVFKLGGKAVLPPTVPYKRPELNPPALTASADTVATGEKIYGSACAMCHGNGGASRGMFPDLRYSAMLHSADAFNAVVLGGALTEKGMVSFKDTLNENDTNAIRSYIISQAIEAKNNPPRGFGQ